MKGFAIVICAAALTALAVSAVASEEAHARDCGSTLQGSRANDRLVGCGRGETLNGRGGADVLRGRGGRDKLRGGRHRDRLVGGRGRDRIRGGAGSDRIRALDGVRDVVACGAGRDRALVDFLDVVRGCEDVTVRSARDPKARPCAPRPAQLLAGGCRVLFDDVAEVSQPRRIWQDLACADDSRVGHQGGGDPHRFAPAIGSTELLARSVRVLDGDDYFGRRCELGKNSRVSGPTAVYGPGTRRITFMSIRLGSSFVLSESRWQAVMQMKQTAPADGSGGTPALELDAYSNAWRLRQSGSLFGSSTGRQLWSAPAQKGVWTRFAFDITYSPDPAQGKIKVYVDRNGDGDATDSGEQSPVIETATLKRETAGSTADGIAEGDPIPSHLRTGIYHDPTYKCPPPGGCEVDVDNIQVLAVD